ncbi:Putative transmembrane transport protein (modular protein) [Frankia canadensis]|uniref:Transmembrane transport protein (Modular protein) n=1 Tax=Frankia canadensis TaxID=1836972 RepID=A0A2I2KXZ5_9ACTN|nr:DLW-39 family protein [Frankia canadensis]SNQ50529.1 Putative transmembrane transport protein (modular protein) [Frankia canadensis]SOU57819.1 Putative transmembrane transport protein (modular protein) [Frankia canadensis]
MDVIEPPRTCDADDGTPMSTRRADMARKMTVLALLAGAGAALTAARRRARGGEEIDLWREATSTAGTTTSTPR